VEVVIEDCEAADGDGESLGEELEPGFDPGLAVDLPPLNGTTLRENLWWCKPREGKRCQE
jgi:hypothetical protein